MDDLVVKNGVNASKSEKKDSSSENITRTTEKTERHFPSLNSVSERSNERTIVSRSTVSGVTDLNRRETGPVLQPYQPRFEPEEYILLLHDEVRQLRQLAASIGIKKELEIADKANKLKLKTAERLEKNRQTSWWRQSKRWAKHRSEVEEDTKKERASKVHGIDLDKLQMPKGMRRRLEPVSIPDLGCTYRLPLLRNQTDNDEVNLLTGSCKRHRAICNIIFKHFLSDSRSKPNG